MSWTITASAPTNSCVCVKCSALNPWININMLSGTVAEMKDWMEYCNRAQPTDLAKEREANGHKAPSGVKYWGIGNEVWAGGGTMAPADLPQ